MPMCKADDLQIELKGELSKTNQIFHEIVSRHSWKVLHLWCHKQKPKTIIFFHCRLAASFENLNSSLAQLTGELWRLQKGVKIAARAGFLGRIYSYTGSECANKKTFTVFFSGIPSDALTKWVQLIFKRVGHNALSDNKYMWTSIEMTAHVSVFRKMLMVDWKNLCACMIMLSFHAVQEKNTWWTEKISAHAH